MPKLSGTFVLLLFVIFSFITSIVIAVYAIDLYFDRFSINGFGGTEHFARFGDYIGGILNPVLTFLTISLLLLSIYLQSKELKASTEELKNTAAAMKDSAASQQELLSLQLNNTLRQEIGEKLDEHYVRFDNLMAEALFNVGSPASPNLRSLINLKQINQKNPEPDQFSNPIAFNAKQIIDKLKEQQDLEKYNSHIDLLREVIGFFYVSAYEMASCTYSKSVKAFHHDRARTAIKYARIHYLLNEAEAAEYIAGLDKVY